MSDTVDWMVLSQIPGIGPARFWTLVRRFGSPGEVLRQPAGLLRKVQGIGEKHLQGFANRQSIHNSCQTQLGRLRRMGGQCLTALSSRYPDILKHINDPPPLLYVLGEAESLGGTNIAMVGSRAATSYGLRIAYDLAARLAGRGVTVVSGLALGIDAQAHRGALASQGKTIGVLGCGLDIVYPRQNGELYKEIARQGAIVTEYPLGTAPEGFRFPARNRIIAGLSKGVAVVEAARKSGSLITAQLALEEGREVYAVPGRVDSGKSAGTHWLLQQGAKLIQSEEDILEDLGEHQPIFSKHLAPADGATVAAPNSNANRLLALLDTYPLAREELLAKSGMNIAEFSEHLLLLELDGLIEVLPGDEIRRMS